MSGQKERRIYGNDITIHTFSFILSISVLSPSGMLPNAINDSFAYCLLRYWNLGCCLLHLVQAIVCLASGLSEGSKAAEFKLPLTTLFLVWTEEYPDGPRYPSQKLNQVGLLPFTAVTSIFSWLSSAAHLIVLLNFDMYIKDLRRGINQFRWYEYALSSSLMIGLIAALFGMYDVISLVLIMSVNACMNLFGYNMENNSDIKNKKIDWISFCFGCFAGVVPWCCVLAYVGGSPDVSNIPEFVWGILVTYFIMFLTFPLNMCLQYFGVSYWSDSYQGHSMGGTALIHLLIFTYLLTDSLCRLPRVHVRGKSVSNIVTGSEVAIAVACVWWHESA